MKKCFAILCAVLAGSAFGYIEDHLPVLPAPQSYTSGNQAREVDVGAFTLIVNDASGKCSGNCLDILLKGFTRIVKGSIQAQQNLPKWRLSLHPEVDAVPPATPTAGLSKISAVSLTITGNSRSEVVPQLGATEIEDEWYSLSIPTEGDVILNAKTVFGALHGFETIAQLAEWDDEPNRFTVGRLPLTIDDFPRFKWRGIMLDVARHFYPMSKVKNFVDAAANMKMNVLHLHLSDAQSFAFQIEGIATHSKATFGKKAVYTHADVKDLLEYALYRGVHIVPEIDIPAHTGSWRHFDEDLIANCWDYLVGRKGNYMDNQLALNPASPKVWEVIKLILTEVAETFDSPYTHIGGDEVTNACWQNAKQLTAIKSWMAANNITDFSGVERYFNLFTQKSAYETKKRPIVWEDCFVNGNMMDTNVIVHVWRNTERLVRAVKAGHDVIQSYGFYTDREDPLCSGTCSGVNWMFSWTFHDFYAQDLVKGLGLTEEEEKHVLGGEAAQWSESTDPVNVDAMALSRTVAIAERLWSPATYTDPRLFEPRSQRFRCLAVRRGFSKAGPLSSDYCELADY